MFTYASDFNGDGWPDILVLGRVHLHQAFWHENPRGANRPWKKHFAFHRVKGESPPFTDVDGDGRPEIVAHWENRWGLIQPQWDAPEEPWQFRPISETGSWKQFYHGTGVGDVNGDGRPDILINDGWWEQPQDGSAPWPFVPFVFGDKGGAQMFAHDVNGDGRNDVVTSLDGHGWGLAWFEQRAPDAVPRFRRHDILTDRASADARGDITFSQPHALALADLNQDGFVDIVCGKRLWAHGPQGDVEPMRPPVLYWFEGRPNAPEGPRFLPRLIDDYSGLGVQLTVGDVNHDGVPDILSASKLGAFAFLSR